MTPPARGATDWLVRAYRLLLLAYSPRFRRAYGEDLTWLFRSRCLQALAERGRLGLYAWVIRAALDVAWNAPPERLGAARGAASSNVRFAVRMLARQPGLSATLVLTMALGIGATVALFSLVDAALLRPLPYPMEDRLVLVRQVAPEFGPSPFAPPYLEDLRERTSGIESLSGFSPSWGLTLTGLGPPRRVVGAYVSAETFALLGVRPVAGRTFESAELVPGGARAVVVSQPFWNVHFGEESPLDGQALELDGETYPIVGIAPAFPLPITSSAVSQGGRHAELWLPFSANPYATSRIVPVMNVIGRLAEGSDVGRVRGELDAAGRSIAGDHPETSDWTTLTAAPLGEAVTQGGRGVLTLFGAAASLLLIACANVANLLLGRATARGHELSVRRSLGAGRRQIVEQLLTESLVIAALGGGLGLLGAWLLLSGMPAAGLAGLPPTAEVRVDLRVAAFAALLALGTALVFGLAPVTHALRDLPARPLRDGGRVSGGGKRLRNALVTSEVALAVTLLVGAGLLARSFWNLVHVDPGFRAEGLLQVPISFGGDRYADPGSRRAFLDELLPKLAALPGVTRTAAVNRLPLGGGNVFVGFEIEGSTPSDGSGQTADRRVTTPGYFAVMGIPVVEGRDFSAGDRADGAATAIVNEAFVRRFPVGASPVGRRLRLELQSGPGPWLTVVGVAGDVRHHGLHSAPEPEIYVPYAQASVAGMTVLVRADAHPASLLPAARAHVWEIDPQVPLDGAGAVTELVRISVEEPRFRTLLLNGFAGLALLLSAIGIYGVVSYSVTRRTRETGLRIALGAPPGRVLLEVIGQGMAFVGWGLLLGLGGAWVVGRLLSGLLFGVEPRDPLTLASVVGALLLVALAASVGPAVRAARVDPVRALQRE